MTHFNYKNGRSEKTFLFKIGKTLSKNFLQDKELYNCYGLKLVFLFEH